MNIQIIRVPYDCGHKELRQGLGPGRFIQKGLIQHLEADGHRVNLSQIEAQSEFTIEVQTAFELNRLLSDEVRATVTNGFFPVVLSGNCNSCLGTIAGIGADQLGIIWFDAHGEFNTPETTLSGFLDGMPLAMATGRCWKSVVKTIPGFAPIPENNVVLVGARDLDDEEERQLEESQVNVIRSDGMDDAGIIEAMTATINQLIVRVRGIYVHIDMDAFEIGKGAANHYGATGGLKPEFVIEALATIKKDLSLVGCGFASYDPAYDPEDKFLKAAMRCIRQIVSE